MCTFFCYVVHNYHWNSLTHIIVCIWVQLLLFIIELIMFLKYCGLARALIYEAVTFRFFIYRRCNILCIHSSLCVLPICNNDTVACRSLLHNDRETSNCKTAVAKKRLRKETFFHGNERTQQSGKRSFLSGSCKGFFLTRTISSCGPTHGGGFVYLHRSLASRRRRRKRTQCLGV
jgi:hypothetical protein